MYRIRWLDRKRPETADWGSFDTASDALAKHTELAAKGYWDEIRYYDEGGAAPGTILTAEDLTHQIAREKGAP